MYLGFSKKKIMSILLLLGCIFISLAMSDLPFLKNNMKVLEGNTNASDDNVDETADEPSADNTNVNDTTESKPKKCEPVPCNSAEQTALMNNIKKCYKDAIQFLDKNKKTTANRTKYTNMITACDKMK